MKIGLAAKLFMEVTCHTLLSDKMGFHFFELPKLSSDVGKDNMLLLRFSLFKAEMEEELEKIKMTEVTISYESNN